MDKNYCTQIQIVEKKKKMIAQHCAKNRNLCLQINYQRVAKLEISIIQEFRKNICLRIVLKIQILLKEQLVTIAVQVKHHSGNNSWIKLLRFIFWSSKLRLLETWESSAASMLRKHKGDIHLKLNVLKRRIN